MTLMQFKRLKEEDQIQKVYNEGVYIGDRFEKEFTIVLYELDNVCVELYYHELETEPVGIKTFIPKEQFELRLQEVA